MAAEEGIEPSLTAAMTASEEDNLSGVVDTADPNITLTMNTCKTTKTVLPDVTATDSSNTEDMSLPDVIITQTDDTKAAPKKDSAVDQSVNIENIGDKVSNVKKKVSAEGQTDVPTNTPDSKEPKPKKEKVISESMQRLTAKKGESPEVVKKRLVTAEQRKAKADESRKKKIMENRTKEDDKRAAVLERKKKLEEEERKRKEELFKKLTVSHNERPNLNTIRKRYSVSTSNLSQLRRTKVVGKDITIDENSKEIKTASKTQIKTKPPERPQSAMQRNRPGSVSNLLTSKSKSTGQQNKTGIADTVKTPTKNTTPKQLMRQSLNPRPATALGISSTERRKTFDGTTKKVALKTNQPTSTKDSRSVSAVTIDSGSGKTKSKVENKSKPTNEKSANSTTKPKSPPSTNKAVAPKLKIKEEGKSPLDGEKRNITKAKLKSTSSADKKSKSLQPSEAKLKKDKTAQAKPIASKDSLKNVSSPNNEGKNTKGPTKKQTSSKPALIQKTEEEAKKALAERRRIAKEEAEAKARAERERDEQERIRQEEEARRLAEDLKREEERQALLLEQLRKEEEERAQKLLLEKEQKEKEEKERLEQEQKEREEEIDRKTKLEIEKRQKEQEKKEQELDAERIERKKRVELIMARVSAKRSDGAGDSAESANTELPSSTKKEEPVSPESTRLKVDGILKAKGLGSSSENLLSNNVDEMVGRSVETPEQTPRSENKDAIQIENGEVKHVLIEKKTTKIEQDKENCPIESDTPSLPSEDQSPEKPSLGNNLTSGQGNDTVQSECKTLNTNVEEVLKDSIPKEKELNLESSASDSIKVMSCQMETKDILEHSKNPELCNINETVDNEVPTKTDQIKEDFNDSQNKELSKNEDLICYNTGVEERDEMQQTGGNGLNRIEQDSVAKPEVTPKRNAVESINGNTTDATDERAVEDHSSTTEEEQWRVVEDQMKNVTTNRNGPMIEASSEESKLWQVVEGKVELSECF